MTHSILAPSAADIWYHCEGYITLATIHPEEETDATREGTAAHWLATGFVDGSIQPSISMVGSVAPNGVPVDEDMYWGAMEYYSRVMEHFDPACSGIEQRVDIPRIDPLCFGTPDTWCYRLDNHTLYVWDYKYGHAPVPVFQNKQLISYACGIIDALHLDDLTLTVRFEVVQPRAFRSRNRLRVWEVNASELRGTINHLRLQAHKGLNAGAMCRAGEHCEYCPVKLHCEANRQMAGVAADYAYTVESNQLSNEEMSFELDMVTRALSVLESRQSALRTEIEHRLNAGQRIPNYAKEPKAGHRKWSVPDADMIAAANMMQLDITKTELLSPRQAELKLKSQGIDTAVIEPYIEKPIVGTKLVRIDGSALKHLLWEN